MKKTLVLSVILTALLGCTTHTKTTVVEDEPRASYRTETVTVEPDVETHREGGVLSGVVEVLGDIIALPFRAVGALVNALF